MGKDNRIPGVIKDFAGKPETKNTLSFLSFQDWLAKEETQAKDWVIVARFWKDNGNDFFTFSALAILGIGTVEELLAAPNWDVRLSFGRPFFFTRGGDKTVHYDPGDKEIVGKIEFRPFVIHREFHGYVASTFEVVQNFVLYHEAFFVPDQNEYQRIDEAGDMHPIVKIAKQGDFQTISVDAHHLKDYLAANGALLVRYHDHRRWAEEDIGKEIEGRFKEYNLSSELSSFDLWLRTDIPFKEFKSSSRLLGKDIVFPYKAPDKRHTSFAADDEDEQFCHFIIGRDDNGKDIEATCDEDSLSNYFTDKGTPHFLTPVFFRREVLGKYYQEPSRYRVSDSGVGCLDLWHIPIDMTQEALVQVWLGDLGRIPYKEQLHWRQFNVQPRGTITRHRWMRDFMAQFADLIDDPIYYLRTSLEELQREAKSRFGDVLILDLEEKDRHAYETLHLPLTEEWKELDEHIQALAKVCIDSLNVSFLSKQTDKRIDGKTIKGSLDLLMVFLSQFMPNEADRESALLSFRVIQTLRSTGAAHRKGGEFDKALRRYDLVNIPNRAKARKIVKDLTNAMSGIAAAIRTLL